jgi:uncharacterized membrane protein
MIEKLIQRFGIKPILYLVLGIILLNAVLGLNALAIVNIIRPIIGFLSITIIPGFLILIILKISNLTFSKTILYSVGLSITVAMLSGLFINTFLPIIGIQKPLTFLPITWTLFSIVIILSILAYIKYRNYPVEKISYIRNQKSFLPILLFLTLIPVWAVLGATTVAIRNNNIYLLILIPVIAIAVVTLVVIKNLPSYIYSYAVFTIALALLLHETLISPYLIGWDIHSEYYYQGLVMSQGYWNPTLPNNINAMLSVTILCPIYSIIMHIGSIWVFKIVYSIIFALVPVALFELYRGQTNSRKAFLACFFFISIFTFFTELTGLARQEIAELFFALIILIVVDEKRTSLGKSIMGILFAFSLIVSHYGLAYISIAFFLIGWILVKLFNRISSGKQTNYSGFKINSSLIIIYIFILVAWYIYVSSAEPFVSIVHIGQSLFNNLYQMFVPETRQAYVGSALGADFTQVSLLGKLYRLFQYFTELLLIASLIGLFWKVQRARFNIQYIAFAIVSAVFLGCSIIIPYFSSYINETRIYHISLIVLAPFLIIGIEYIIDFASFLLKYISINLMNMLKQQIVLPIIALIILIPYFLFNTGYIFEIAKHNYNQGYYDLPVSGPLSNYRTDYSAYYAQDADAAQWTEYFNNETAIYSDMYGQLILMDYAFGRQYVFPTDFTQVNNSAYIFLRSWNINEGQLFLSVRNKAQTTVEEVNINADRNFAGMLSGRDLIYTNGGAQLFSPK